MKMHFSVVSFCLLSLFAQPSQAARPMMAKMSRHFDLEMTGPEYEQKINREHITLFAEDGPESDEDRALKVFVNYGKKNLQWVDLINQNRPADQKISFSSEATQSGNDVNNPRVYNFEIIQNRWNVLQTLLPKSLKAVIFQNGALTTTLPVSEREYIEWLFQVDSAYQITTRYMMLKGYKSYYIEDAQFDVRGYLTLKNNADTDQDLKNWSGLSDIKQERYRKALINICQNSEVKRRDCVDQFQKSLQTSTLLDLKNKYMPKAETNYNNFFAIPEGRKDVTWNSSNSNLFSIPFADPKNDRVLDYLKTNIEDEWQWGDWKLVLNFVNSTASDTTHVVFQDGALPHVDGIAGSEITMDANAPLSEYDVQWTIRHEYGHVLGFPDCYFEFYDESLDAFVSYQLDITNLMCSRRGHLQQRHFDELKRVYFKTI